MTGHGYGPDLHGNVLLRSKQNAKLFFCFHKSPFKATKIGHFIEVKIVAFSCDSNNNLKSIARKSYQIGILSPRGSSRVSDFLLKIEEGGKDH